MGHEHSEKVFHVHILIHLAWCAVSLWLHNKAGRARHLLPDANDSLFYICVYFKGSSPQEEP